MNLSIIVKNYKGKVCNMYQDEYKRWLRIWRTQI